MFFWLFFVLNVFAHNLQLTKSAINGDLDSVENLLKLGFVPDRITMVAACHSGNVDLVLLLLTLKLHVGKWCLDAAIQSESMNLIEFLIEGNHVFPTDRSLILASRLKSPKIELYLAAITGRIDYFMYKMDELDIDYKIIRAAIFSNNVDLVKCLFEFSNFRIGSFRNLVLHDSIKTGNLNLIRYLIVEKGIIPDIWSLNLACMNGFFHIAEFLMSNKKSNIIPDKFTLLYAIDGKNWTLVQYLIQEWKIIPDFNQLVEIHRVFIEPEIKNWMDRFM